MEGQPGKGCAIGELDELLQPTLQAQTTKAGTARPWRLSSQLWVAFFGGTGAYLTIALLNGVRLRMPRRKLVLLTAAGAVALVASLGVASYLQHAFPGTTGRGYARLGSRLIAVLFYVVGRRVQTPFDRVFEVLRRGEHASLWVAGLLAVLGIGTLQSVAAWSLEELWR